MAVNDLTRSTAAHHASMTVGAAMSVRLDGRGCPQGIPTLDRSHNSTTERIGSDENVSFHLKRYTRVLNLASWSWGRITLSYFNSRFLCALQWAARRLSPFFQRFKRGKSSLYPQKHLRLLSIFWRIFVIVSIYYDCMTCMIYEGYHFIYLLHENLVLGKLYFWERGFWVHGMRSCTIASDGICTSICYSLRFMLFLHGRRRRRVDLYILLCRYIMLWTVVS